MKYQLTDLDGPWPFLFVFTILFGGMAVIGVVFG
jgi:hypothetical protein